MYSSTLLVLICCGLLWVFGLVVLLPFAGGIGLGVMWFPDFGVIWWISRFRLALWVTGVSWCFSLCFVLRFAMVSLWCGFGMIWFDCGG